MSHKASSLPPWYLWPALPLVAAVGLLATAILSPLLLLGLVYGTAHRLNQSLFPERREHFRDTAGTDVQKARAQHWRQLWLQLSLAGRVRHARKRARMSKRRFPLLKGAF